SGASIFRLWPALAGLVARRTNLMQQTGLRAVPERQDATAAAPTSRAIVAEAIGTAFLVAAVVGSGIMGEQLAGGNVAVALLANTLATGAALVALILAVGPIS